MIGGESTRQFRVDFVPFWSIPLAAQCVARRATLANNARLTVIDHHFGSWVAQESRWAVGQAVGAGETILGWLLPTLVVGVPLMWFIGQLLDRLHADVRVWSLAAVVGAATAGFLMLPSYTHLDSAFERHGSFWAFMFCSLQLGSYGATLLLLVFSAGRRS